MHRAHRAGNALHAQTRTFIERGMGFTSKVGRAFRRPEIQGMSNGHERSLATARMRKEFEAGSLTSAEVMTWKQIYASQYCVYVIGLALMLLILFLSLLQIVAVSLGWNTPLAVQEDKLLKAYSELRNSNEDINPDIARYLAKVENRQSLEP
ncbi:hypothetical protein DIPPA_04762 [Diplonema papillatum]|nr:hypothetical protein DIPPA_04762 [Diplonema papillatum]|eukprot:gene12785-19726_t